MRDEWIAECLRLSRRPAEFYTGCRKIVTGRSFDLSDLADDLSIADCGFTRSKLTMLRRLYLHEESRDMAVRLWERRMGQGKYGSVGFTCYNHLLKADPEKKSKRASVMGPCIQSVVITLLNNRTVNIDAFYRTTELLKKFPADLVFLRDELLPPFNIPPERINRIRFHFAGITVHPMYFVTIIPLIRGSEHRRDVSQMGWVIGELNRIKERDRRFFDWVVKWTARYVCDEYMRGIAKFAQAMRVRKDALSRIEPDQLPILQKYLRDNHPGYRNDYVPPEGEDDDE